MRNLLQRKLSSEILDIVLIRSLLLSIVVVCTCFSEKVTWEEVKPFFVLEQGGFFPCNLEKLIKMQLRLDSGQSLWKAFIFLRNKTKDKFTFCFRFVLNNSSMPNISLERCIQQGEMRLPCFVFNITCNKIFAEKSFSDEEISCKNKLCRPCLIKLNDEYHLREQELPFFITFAHEFLHGLNQVERLSAIINDDLLRKLFSPGSTQHSIIIEDERSMQVFLAQKIFKTDTVTTVDLTDQQLKPWGMDRLEDSLDEMSVILGSLRRISDTEEVLIGETSFLRDLYPDKHIISWTHHGVHDIGLWQEVMPILLKSTYVDKVRRLFQIESYSIACLDVSGPFEEKQCVCFCNSYNIGVLKTYLQGFIDTCAPRQQIMTFFLNVRVPTCNFSYRIHVFQSLSSSSFVLPKIETLKANPVQPRSLPRLETYTVIGADASGNSAFSSVVEACKKFELPASVQKVAKSHVTLRKQTADLMLSMDPGRADFIMMLRKSGFWNNGVDGEVGFRVLNYVARIVEQPILVLVGDIDGGFRYWISKPLGASASMDVSPESIGERKPEQLLDEHPECIKLFHNGIYYQLIVPKSEVATE